jgi:hypothetical protein
MTSPPRPASAAGARKRILAVQGAEQAADIDVHAAADDGLLRAGYPDDPGGSGMCTAARPTITGRR